MGTASYDAAVLRTVRDAWGWSGLAPEELVGENDFGHRIIRDVHGRYWHLAPDELLCEIVAQTRSGFETLAAGEAFQADWSMRALRARAREALGALPPDGKYHLALPAPLGGTYGPDNLVIADSLEQIRTSGDMARRRAGSGPARLRCFCGRC